MSNVTLMDIVNKPGPWADVPSGHVAPDVLASLLAGATTIGEAVSMGEPFTLDALMRAFAEIGEMGLTETAPLILHSYEPERHRQWLIRDGASKSPRLLRRAGMANAWQGSWLDRVLGVAVSAVRVRAVRRRRRNKVRKA